MSESKIPVGILGATGTVGQRFVSLLANHPWFEITLVTGSERSVGKLYRDATEWLLPLAIPKEIATMKVQPSVSPEWSCPLLFSALDSTVAGPIESELARAGHIVVTNTKSHRMDADVPLIVPEVNPDHMKLIRRQEFGDGAIIANPNCSTIGLVLSLKPLAEAFGIKAVHVVTLQALSGAGLPGVPGLMAIDNVIPFIDGEEEKLEIETQKILGTLGEREVEPAAIELSAQCMRVGVLDGHTECVSVSLEQPATLEDVHEAYARFVVTPNVRNLPSTPPNPLIISHEAARPQPRLDRWAGAGMSVTIGRLRPCPLFDYKFVLLSHNTIRGAAGGAVLVAELAVATGALSSKVVSS